MPKDIKTKTPKVRSEKQNTKILAGTMFSAVGKAMKPTEKILAQHSKLIEGLTKSMKGSAEDNLEAKAAADKANKEQEEQTGWMAKIFNQGKKDKKEGGLWSWLKKHWLPIGIGLLAMLTPLKKLGKYWEKMFGGDGWGEIGTKIGLAVLAAIGVKMAAGALFTGLAKMIMTALLPAGAPAGMPAAGALGAVLLPVAAIVGFIGGAVKSIWDGIEGADLSKEWGVDKVDGAIGGFIGGTGKGLSGALGNALAKGGMGAGIGFAVGGPVGMLVGGILGASFGAITGYIGGEKIAKWVKSTRTSIKETWRDMSDAIDGLNKGLDEWGKEVSDDAIQLLRDVTGNDKIGMTQEERRRAEVGGDMSNLSVEKQNKIQKEEHKKEDKKLRGGASSAVAKGDLKGIEAEIESIYADMDAANQTKENFAGERKQKLIPLKKRLDKLKGDADAIYEAREAQKAKKVPPPSTPSAGSGGGTTPSTGGGSGGGGGAGATPSVPKAEEGSSGPVDIPPKVSASKSTNTKPSGRKKASSFSLSQNGRNLIQKYEQFVPHIYDPHGKPITTASKNNEQTIGFGHLLKKKSGDELASVSEGNKFVGGGIKVGGKTKAMITPEEGQGLFSKDVKHFEDYIRSKVKVPINQNQFDALTSLAFNVGKFKSSWRLTKALKSKYGNYRPNRYRYIAENMLDINKSGKKVMAGLTARRKEESALFMAAAEGFHGMVKKPTVFLTGEAGPELVNITPMSEPDKRQQSIANLQRDTLESKSGSNAPIIIAPQNQTTNIKGGGSTTVIPMVGAQNPGKFQNV